MTYLERNMMSTYAHLFEGLSTMSKIELIELLTKSLKKQVFEREKVFFQSYGAFGSDQNTEDIIKEIKENRHFVEKNLNF